MTTKKLPPTLLAHTYEQYFRIWNVKLPPGYGYEDLFSPGFWSHHSKLRADDLIRVTAHDRSFDLFITVLAAPQGGAVVDVWPRYPGGTDAAAAKSAAERAKNARPDKVPFLPSGKPAIRVEFLPATKYRVIALDQSELARDFETSGEATERMMRYVRELGMAYPTIDEIKAAEEAAKAAEAERKAKKPAGKAA